MIGAHKRVTGSDSKYIFVQPMDPMGRIACGFGKVAGILELCFFLPNTIKYVHSAPSVTSGITSVVFSVVAPAATYWLGAASQLICTRVATKNPEEPPRRLTLVECFRRFANPLVL